MDFDSDEAADTANGVATNIENSATKAITAFRGRTNPRE
jgi:hypothetical protein